MSEIADKRVVIEKNSDIDTQGIFFVPCGYDIFVVGVENRGTMFGEILSAERIAVTLCDGYSARYIGRYLAAVSARIPISAIVKDKNLLDICSDVKFADYTVDSAIDYNYIAIKGNGRYADTFYLYADKMYISDDEVFVNFFGGKSNKNPFVIKKVIVADRNSIYLDTALSYGEEGYEVDYIISPSDCDQKIFENYGNKFNIYLCESVAPAIFELGTYGTCRQRIPKHNTNITIFADENRIRSYFSGNFYRKVQRNAYNSIENPYIFHNGIFGVFSLREDVTLRRKIECKTFEEYETLDAKNLNPDLYGDYSMYLSTCKKVKYIIDIVPPLYKRGAYLIHPAFANWQKGVDLWRKYYRATKLDGMIDVAKRIHEGSEKDFSTMAYELDIIDKRITEAETGATGDFREWLKKEEKILRFQRRGIVDVITEMYDSTYVDHDKQKIQNLENEIEHIKKNKEKKKKERNEINASAIDARIIEYDLEINRLQSMVKRFAGEHVQRAAMERDKFIEHCNMLLSGEQLVSSFNALDVVRGQNKTESDEMMESFCDVYLLTYCKYLDNLTEALKSMQEGEIPNKFGLFIRGENNFVTVSEQEDIPEAKRYAESHNAALLVMRKEKV